MPAVGIHFNTRRPCPIHIHYPTYTLTVTTTMLSLRTTIFFAVLVAVAHATMVVKEPNTALPAGSKHYKSLGKSKPADVVNIVVMLQHTEKQRALLEETFFAVSDPTNEHYGEHLTQSQVTKLVQNDRYEEVVSWLRRHGAKRIEVGVHKDLVEADLTVENAEKLLHTEFHVFQHSVVPTVQLHRAVRDYSVPTQLDDVISIVGNVVRFPAINLPVVGTGDAEGAPTSTAWPQDCKGCGTNKVTPGVLAARYGFPTKPVANAKGSLAVAEFQGQAWDQSDVAKFTSSCGLENYTVDHPINAPQSAACKIPVLGVQFCGEALLDIEYALAVAAGIPLTDINLKVFSLLNWAKEVSAMPDGKVPLIHSVSYGNDEVQQTGIPYMLSVNVEFQKLGVRGISVLFASGDQGVMGRSGGGARFHPDFPAASPYVTAVGGTDFATATTIGDEKAWVDGGGGFSDTFGIPSYQKAAVENYIKTATGLPPQTYWNSTGRGYPDIAALAGQQNPYCIAGGSLLMGIAGTSAACPTAASIFARLNEERLAKGGKPLGFLNPWIYQNAEAFNDVTQGSNSGGGVHGGFPAVKGWDASTGVGTPNYEAMVKKL
jgi:tripeptidyl-peptidase I